MEEEKQHQSKNRQKQPDTERHDREATEYKTLSLELDGSALQRHTEEIEERLQNHWKDHLLKPFGRQAYIFDSAFVEFWGISRFSLVLLLEI